MKPQPIRIGYVSFNLGNDLHITVVRRYDATDNELIEMQKHVDHVLRPSGPYIIEFGNFCHMGENGTYPAYKVYFIVPTQLNLLESFHKKFYKEAPGKRLYYKPKFHITVDTPEKLEALETLIRSSYAENKATMTLYDLSFKTRVEGDTPQISDSGSDEGWRCSVCGILNGLDHKFCRGVNCDQWRPRELVKLPVEKPGDWTCSSCNFNNFASRDQCKNCNRPKVKYVIDPKQDPYNIPPASSLPSAPPMNELPMRKKFNQDWTCPRCIFKVFGSKDKCGKCGTKAPHA